MVSVLNSSPATQTLVLTGQTEEENNEDDPFTSSNIEVYSTHVHTAYSLVLARVPYTIPKAIYMYFNQQDTSCCPKSHICVAFNQDTSPIGILTLVCPNVFMLERFHSGSQEPGIETLFKLLLHMQASCEFVPVVASRSVLTRLHRSEVLVKQWGPPIGNQYYRSIMPDFPISICGNCNKVSGLISILLLSCLQLALLYGYYLMYIHTYSSIIIKSVHAMQL